MLVIFKKIYNYLNEIAGVPNYERYLEYLNQFFPDETPIDKNSFYRQRIEEKYNSKDIRRCC